jgi:hypothetical protein
MLLQVKKNGGSLEDRKVVARSVDKNWDTPIGVQLYEPRLLLFGFGEIYPLDTVGKLVGVALLQE